MGRQFQAAHLEIFAVLLSIFKNCPRQFTRAEASSDNGGRLSICCWGLFSGDRFYKTSFLLIAFI
jgi:hypothetical protein